MNGAPASSDRALRSSALHVAVGFVGMGCWAAFANRDHAMPAPLIAGLVQGCLSGVLTLVMKRMIEAVSARLKGPGGAILPPLLAVGLSLAVLSALHLIAGTPEIAATIALPLTVTAIYSTSYSLALRRNR